MRSFQLDRSSGSTLAEQIKKSIETRIINGSYRPGQRLPSTRHLSEELGVSRSTVSEAFDMLMADGLINGVTGSAPTSPDVAAARRNRLDGRSGRDAGARR